MKVMVIGAGIAPPTRGIIAGVVENELQYEFELTRFFR